MKKSKVNNKVLSSKSGFVMDMTNKMKPRSFESTVKNIKQYARVKH